MINRANRIVTNLCGQESQTWLSPEELAQGQIDYVASRLMPNKEITTEVPFPGTSRTVTIWRAALDGDEAGKVCFCSVLFQPGTYASGIHWMFADATGATYAEAFALSLRTAMTKIEEMRRD
jgi:hypothetical protein